MSKRNRTYKILHMSSEEVTLNQMPKYNGYGVGYGPHKNMKKYSRKSKYKDAYLYE